MGDGEVLELRAMNTSRIARRIALVGAGALALAACGGDATETAEAVIETEIAEQMGLGELTATCEEPPNRDIGTTYDCTATTADGQTVTLLSRFTEEDRIFVLPSNVIVASEVPLLKEQAAALLGPEVGVEIDPASIECPDGDSIVLSEAGTIDCTILTPDGVLFPLTVTLENFDFDTGFQNLFVEIGQEPIG